MQKCWSAKSIIATTTHMDIKFNWSILFLSFVTHFWSQKSSEVIQNQNEKNLKNLYKMGFDHVTPYSYVAFYCCYYPLQEEKNIFSL